MDWIMSRSIREFCMLGESLINGEKRRSFFSVNLKKVYRKRYYMSILVLMRWSIEKLLAWCTELFIIYGEVEKNTGTVLLQNPGCTNYL